MSTLDLAALARDAAEQTAAKVREEMRSLLREELERISTERLFDRPGLAKYLGITAKALGMRLSRGSALAGIAFMLDGRQAWRKSDIDALTRGAR